MRIGAARRYSDAWFYVKWFYSLSRRNTVVLGSLHRSTECPSSFNYAASVGHFIIWISLSLSEIATYTHMPQRVYINYRGHLHMSSSIDYFYTKGERSDADE